MKTVKKYNPYSFTCSLCGALCKDDFNGNESGCEHYPTEYKKRDDDLVYLKIPLGSFDLYGRWFFNEILIKSEEQQRNENIENGFICEHEYNKGMCPICKKI